MQTQSDLLEFLREAGFKRGTIEERPGDVPVRVTLTGFGRLKRLTAKETEEIRQKKPVFAKIIFTRKLFCFRLWEINV